jgi:Uncharacterized protein conserved in bacteria
MSDTFTFISAGQEADLFRILRFTGTEAVSECYNFDLELLALKEFDIQTLYNASAVFNISRQDGTSTDYHGRVAELAVERMSDGEYFKCRIRFVPHLWFYTLRQSSKVYVGKSIAEIIDLELEENGEGVFGGFSTRFVQLPQTSFPLIIKYHETSLEFISRLLQRECLYYYFLSEDGKDTLTFSSDRNLSSNETLSAQVINELAFSALGVDDERILSKSAHMAQAQLSELVNLYAHDGNPDSVETLHGVGRTAIEKNMLGPLRDISNIRMAQDSQDLLRYTMATSIQGVRVGSTYDGLRALSLGHEGDQSSAVLESLGMPTDVTQQDFCRNQGIWMPEGEAFIPEWTLEAPRIAHASLTGFTTRINDDGTYDVKCPGIDAETDLPNVRMMFPFAGEKGSASGLHYPLVDGTEVLLEFLDGDPDRPVILGTLYNSSVATPITALNRQKHILETPQRQMFHLIDGEENKMHFEGQNRIEMLSQSEMLEVDSTQAHIKGQSSNLVSFHADGGTQLALDGSADTVNLQAGNSVKMDMNHGAATIGVVAQAASTDINGQQDDVSLNTGAGTRVVVSGSGNSIQMNTHGGAALDIFGGPGDVSLQTGRGQIAELSKASDSMVMRTSGGAEISLEASKVLFADGAGQSIKLLDGGQALIDFKNTKINLANALISVGQVTAQNGEDIDLGEATVLSLTQGSSDSLTTGACNELCACPKIEQCSAEEIECFLFFKISVTLYKFSLYLAKLSGDAVSLSLYGDSNNADIGYFRFIPFYRTVSCYEKDVTAIFDFDN